MTGGIKEWLCARTLDVLQSRVTLIVISILVIIDCLGVLGQMMSDLHFMRIRFQLEEENVRVFINHLKLKPEHVAFPDHSSISDVLHFLRSSMDVVISDRCSSFCIPQSTATPTNNNEDLAKIDVYNDLATVEITPTPSAAPCFRSDHIWIQFDQGADTTFVVGKIDLNTKRTSSRETDGTTRWIYMVTQSLNVIGVIFVSIMLLEVLVRTICRGRYFYRKKFEMFDNAIVVAAFVIEVAYMFGRWADNPADSASILILLLPWRFVRVVYSLVTAMNHKHHIQMQQMKTSKRTSDQRLIDARQLVLQMEKDIQSLAQLCRRKTATETEIKSCFCRTTTAAVSSFGSTLLMIGAPALSKSSFYHQGSRGHLYQKVFEEDYDQCSEDDDIPSPEKSEAPRTLRRAGPKNPTPPLAYQALTDRPGAPVIAVEPCRRWLSEDDSTTAECSVNEATRSLMKHNTYGESTYL
ncbi:uncharacterized protein [Argopecten irradians]|uniref:uncharacterized protein n=1 Tax=Argopecten irradians TaxID=31199 RepID=UPI003714FFBB